MNNRFIITLLALVATVEFAFGAGPLINTPYSGEAVQCQVLDITWSGGQSPYTVNVRPGDQPNGQDLRGFLPQTGTDLRWLVDFAGGTSILLHIVDATGAASSSASFTVSSSSDSSCLAASSSASATPRAGLTPIMPSYASTTTSVSTAFIPSPSPSTSSPPTSPSASNLRTTPTTTKAFSSVVLLNNTSQTSSTTDAGMSTASSTGYPGILRTNSTTSAPTTSAPTVTGATTNSAAASTLGASSSRHTTTSLGAIAGGVAGSAVLIIIIVLLLFLRRRRQRKELEPPSPDWLSPFESPYAAHEFSDGDSNTVGSTPRTGSLAQIVDQASQSGRKPLSLALGEAVPPRGRIVHEDSGRRFHPNEWIMEEIPPDYSPD